MALLYGPDLVRRLGGAHQRRSAFIGFDEGDDLGRIDAARHNIGNSQPHDRMTGAMMRDLGERRLRATAGQDGLAAGVRSKSAAPARRQPGTMKIAWQAERDAGSARDEQRIGAGLSDGEQVRLADRVDDDQRLSGSLRFVQCGRDVGDAFGDPAPRHETDRAARLLAQPAAQVAVRHRRERMMPQA